RTARETPDAAVNHAYAKAVGLDHIALAAAGEAAVGLEALRREPAVAQVDALRTVAGEADVGVGAALRLGALERQLAPFAILGVAQGREGRGVVLGVENGEGVVAGDPVRGAKSRGADSQRLDEVTASLSHVAGIVSVGLVFVGATTRRRGMRRTGPSTTPT